LKLYCIHVHYFVIKNWQVHNGIEILYLYTANDDKN
jgi:hypothetical protein